MVEGSLFGRALLAGHVAVVVGSSVNIGAGIAVELGKAGAAVACLDQDAQLAELCAGEVRRHGAIAWSHRCDARKEAEVAAVLARVRDDAGVPADVLVNGVVRYNTKGIRTMSVGEWREQIGVMLDAAFVCTKHLTDGLISAGRPGSVVNLISTAGHQGEPGNVGYCTAKGGLLNFTRSVAMELAPYGIRVNSLTPTATDPAQAQERAGRWGVPGVPEDVLRALAVAAGQVPLQLLPGPADYGLAAAFLASDAARAITGIDLPVDAGSLARYWRRPPAEDQQADAR